MAIKVIYMLFYEQRGNQGMAKPFTSLKGLSKFSGIPYSKLVYHLRTKKQVWHFYEMGNVTVIRSTSELEKGKQRVHKRPKIHNRNM